MQLFISDTISFADPEFAQCAEKALFLLLERDKEEGERGNLEPQKEENEDNVKYILKHLSDDLTSFGWPDKKGQR